MRHNFFKNAEILLYFDTIQEKWYIKNNVNGIDYDLSLANNLSSFLQILYEQPVSFFNDVLRVAKEKNVSENFLDTLPFKTSIIFCIKNKMFFWIELSLKWLPFITIDDELKKAIKIVVEDSKSPQKIRHRLMKVIKQ